MIKRTLKQFGLIWRPVTSISISGGTLHGNAVGTQTAARVGSGRVFKWTTQTHKKQAVADTHPDDLLCNKCQGIDSFYGLLAITELPNNELTSIRT